MLSRETYLADPRGTSSLPYWKLRGLVMPENMLVVHQRDFSPEAFPDMLDEPYFRLSHDLMEIPGGMPDSVEIVPGAGRISDFAALINASYDDLRVTESQLAGYRETPVYDPALWLLMQERATGRVVAGGIADFDAGTGEASLEWIQTLPAYRRRGYGRATVYALLRLIRGKARFATVSGQVNHPTHPERLYRSCGFSGDDVWHVLTRKTEAFRP